MARRSSSKPEGTMRLARYIASAGVAARRKAEALIREGHVRVNGERVDDVATNVRSGVDTITVKGTAVIPEPLFYALLNKPKGCITALSDPWDRPTVMDYLPKLPAHVKPVGRLDYYSEGVLLLTNDGELASALLGPASAIEKTYHVKVRGNVRDKDLKVLREGVRIGPRTVTRPAQVDRLKAQSKHDWLVITLTEGKSRQIHRMLEALNLTVTKLQRVAFAGLHFHGLRVGDARELSQGEVAELRKIAGLSRGSSVARGTWQAKREDSELSRRARARARAEREEAEAVAEARSSNPEGGRPSSSKPDSTKNNTKDHTKPRATGKPKRPAKQGRSGARTETRSKPARKTGAKTRSTRSKTGTRTATRGPAKARSGAKTRGPAKARSGAKTRGTSSTRGAKTRGSGTGSKGRSSGGSRKGKRSRN